MQRDAKENAEGKHLKAQIPRRQRRKKKRSE
jgi:hypothetical protein